ncbi:hypothetical protein DL770_010345 [Monosporascus sp. CRB-9-2]|nr:hypothetical protein DL770_010345 [Monosporascus sp. CRB-9-2]
MIKSELARPATRIIIAKDLSQKVIGFAQVSPGARCPLTAAGDTARPAGVEMVYVDPAGPKQGVRSAMVSAVTEFARDEHVQKLWLMVSKSNTTVHRLYSRDVYIVVGDTDFSGGTDMADNFIMVATLARGPSTDAGV